MTEVCERGLIVEGTVTGGGSATFYDPYAGDYEVEVEAMYVDCFDTALEHFEDDVTLLREALKNKERKLPQEFVDTYANKFEDDLLEAAGCEDAQFDIETEAIARGVYS